MNRRGIWDECDFRCRCEGAGTCLPCQLKRVALNRDAFLQMADDHCTCEDRRQCDPCAIVEAGDMHCVCCRSAHDCICEFVRVADGRGPDGHGMAVMMTVCHYHGEFR